MGIHFDIRMRVEEERQRVIAFLKGKGVTEDSDGKRVEDLPLLPLTIMQNKLLAGNNQN